MRLKSMAIVANLNLITAIGSAQRGIYHVYGYKFRVRT
jgi:hypothetical protein